MPQISVKYKNKTKEVQSENTQVREMKREKQAYEKEERWSQKDIEGGSLENLISLEKIKSK